MTGEAGVYVRTAGTAHWAWIGVRLTPDAERGRHESEAEILAAERAWLAGLWAVENGARWEIRYTGNGPDRPVSCVLLGRVSGRDVDAVHVAAAALRDRLAAVPRHVRAEPMTTPQVQAALVPARGDLVEVRKRLDWAWSSRRETGRQVCFAVAPLVPGGPSWVRVQDELARQPPGTTVGIHLEPYAPTQGLAVRLRELAVEYATLGAAGRLDPTWDAGNPADPFAAVAAHGYQQAVRRYTGRCYRTRIAVIARDRVDPGFAALLAAATGGGTVCPPAAHDADPAWRDFVTLDREWLDATYRQGAPSGHLGDAERVLCDVVDVAEAATAFRLPLPGVADWLPATGDVGAAPPPEPTDGRRRIFVSYVEHDLGHVRRLVQDLRQAGCHVWMDRSELLPGRSWRSEISRAIAAGDYFIACFSADSVGKRQTYMNEELIQAVNRLRQMPLDRDWFVPVRFGDCRVPEYEIRPGETLDMLQTVDFTQDWDDALRRVLAVVGRN